MSRPLIFKLLAMCAGTACICACGPQADAGALSQVKQANADLAQRVSALETKSKQLQAELARVRLKVVSLEVQAVEQTAAFDPQAQRGYSAVQSPVGPVLIILDKVEPYLDGFKLTFRVGNPSSANLNGFSAEVTWGPLAAKDSTEDPPRQSTTARFTETLRAGSWTQVTTNVAPATASEVRFLSITPTFDNLGLAKAR